MFSKVKMFSKASRLAIIFFLSFVNTPFIASSWAKELQQDALDLLLKSKSNEIQLDSNSADFINV